MGLLKDFRKRMQAQKDADLLAEEKVYEYVGKEFDSGNVRYGLWTKATAIANSSKDEDIKSEYIKLRVEILKAEGRLFDQFLNEVDDAVVNDEKSAQPKAQHQGNQAADQFDEPSAELTTAELKAAEQSVGDLSRLTAGELYKYANTVRYDQQNIEAGIKFYRKIISEFPNSPQAEWSQNQIDMIRR